MTIPGKYPSKHGAKLGISKDDQTVALGGIVAGGNHKPSIVYPSPDTVAHFDDFLGQAHDTGGVWGVIEGTDTGADGGVAIVSGASNGVLRVRVPNVGLATAGITRVSALIAGRNVQANQGRVRMAARVRGGVPGEDTGVNPNALSMFIGFTDDTGTVEVPAYVDTGANAGAGVTGKITAVATNAFGLLHDSAHDTGNGWSANRWHGVAVNGGSVNGDTPGPEGSNGLQTGKWSVVECELDANPGDTGGTARFWVDGVPIGQIDAPVASTARLTPVISLGSHISDTGSIAVDVDWVAFSFARDTGD